MTADIQALKDAFGKFSTDFSKFAADVTAKLATIPTPDPTDATTLKEVTSAMNTMDQNVTDLDTKING